MSALTGQAYYQYELKRLLSEEIERLKENLLSAYHIEGFDFAAYRHQVGKIEGIRMAIELCDEAEAIINGADKRG